MYYSGFNSFQFFSGLLEKLCTILMASGVPADVLTETINTVSEVIRGNQANQEYFASVMAPSNPPRCNFSLNKLVGICIVFSQSI